MITGNEVSQTVNNFGYDPRTTATLQSELAGKHSNQMMIGADYNQIMIKLGKEEGIPNKDIYNFVWANTVSFLRH